MICLPRIATRIGHDIQDEQLPNCSNNFSNFIMKIKLPLDLDILNELNISREDNLLHQKIILCKSLQEHRGCKEPLMQTAKLHKQIHSLFTQIEEQRALYQQSLFKRYDNVEVSLSAKSTLFGFISKAQRIVKAFSTKLHSILNPIYQSVCSQAAEHQTELRHTALQKINKEIKLGTFLRQFQNLIVSRYKRESSKFLTFYQSYGYLVDKRAQKPELTSLKQQKYKLVSTVKSVEFSVKSFEYCLGTLIQTQNASFQNSIKGIKYLDIDESCYQTVLGIHQSVREDGFCEAYISKIEKLVKDLFLRNAPIQKFFPVSVKAKEKELAASRAASKAQRQSFNSRKSMSQSVGKNLRNSNIQNVGQRQVEKEKQKAPERRSVLRQTLIEIVINQRQPHPKHAEPHLSQVFLPSIRDKPFRNQTYNLYKKIYCVKENS